VRELLEGRGLGSLDDHGFSQTTIALVGERLLVAAVDQNPRRQVDQGFLARGLARCRWLGALVEYTARSRNLSLAPLQQRTSTSRSALMRDLWL
jgi:hypothetical protein